MDTCVFCSVVTGALPSARVFEDDQVVAFLDVNPQTEGHLLVVPRAHATSVLDLTPELSAHLWLTGQRLARALYASDLPTEGLTFFLTDRSAGGQEVMHAHLHVLPRQEGDGFRLRGKPQRPSRETLTERAARVRSALES